MALAALALVVFGAYDSYPIFPYFRSMNMEKIRFVVKISNPHEIGRIFLHNDPDIPKK